MLTDRNSPNTPSALLEMSETGRHFTFLECKSDFLRSIPMLKLVLFQF